MITGKVTSPATFYATAGGIVAAFISVFLSFGYIRLSDRLRKTVNNPEKVSLLIYKILIAYDYMIHQPHKPHCYVIY